MKEVDFRRYMREAYALGKNDGWEINFEELLNRICLDYYGEPTDFKRCRAAVKSGRRCMRKTAIKGFCLNHYEGLK